VHKELQQVTLWPGGTCDGFMKNNVLLRLICPEKLPNLVNPNSDIFVCVSIVLGWPVTGLNR